MDGINLIGNGSLPGVIRWMDQKLTSGQLNVLADNEKRWFYNYKPDEPEGKQCWIRMTHAELADVYLREMEEQKTKTF